MDPISLGLGAVSVGSSVLGLFGKKKKVDPKLEQAQMLLSIQENQLRQQQMNLDANRRKRDVLRNAQVAYAQSQAIAAGQGAANSSFASGATSSVSGQAGNSYLGISQNQEIGNQLFTIDLQQALISREIKKQSGPSSPGVAEYAQGFGNIISKHSDSLHSIFSQIFA